MSHKGDDELSELPYEHAWSDGFTWIAYPDEDGKRASHALTTESGVWLVDPVEAPGLHDRLSLLGDVAGVIVLQDRHTRDAATIARRYDLAVSVPGWMLTTIGKLDGSPERLGETVPGTDYSIHKLVDTDDWEESFLVDERGSTMVVPEAVGTISSFLSGDNELGVHPALEEPPRILADWKPDRILVGHGRSIHRDAADRLRKALDAL